LVSEVHVEGDPSRRRAGEDDVPSLLATIVCPYATSVPDRILAHARQTHPEVAEAGDGTASLADREPEDFPVTPT
jgi:hypothetical protein